MTEGKKENQPLPTIDEIVQRKLSDIANVHGNFADHKVPSSLEEWTRVVKSDPHQEQRSVAIAGLYAAIPRRGDYNIGDPRDIERILDVVPSVKMSDLLAYFLEASIANIDKLFESLKRAKESLAFEKNQTPPDDYWLQETQRRVEEDIRLLDEAMMLYTKYTYLYEHIDDKGLQQEILKAFQESDKTPRSFLK